jgi:hypothetical protein
MLSALKRFTLGFVPQPFRTTLCCPNRKFLELNKELQQQRQQQQHIIIIIIIIIIGKDTIPFMQGIYTYIPETNHVPKEYNVAAILSLLFMAPISLAPVLALMYFYISTFRSM